MLTRQEIYDKVKAHLVKQGRPARQGTTCMYRTPDGAMCAAGCLIPDDKYSTAMEGSAVPTDPYALELARRSTSNFDEGAAAVGDALIAAGIKPEDFCVIRDLQWLHDTFPADTWPVRLAALANRYGLEDCPCSL